MRFEAWVEVMFPLGNKRIFVSYFKNWQDADAWIHQKSNESILKGLKIGDSGVNYS